MSRLRFLATVLVAVTLASAGGGLALLALAGALNTRAATPAELAVAIGGLGSLILWRRPGNRIGGVMAGTGALFGLSVLAAGTLMQNGAPHAWREVALAGAWLSGALSVPWALLLMWYPDRGFTATGWRRLFILGTLVCLTVAIAAFLVSPPGADLPAIFPVAHAPAHLGGPLASGTGTGLGHLVDAVLLAFPLAALLCLVSRYRRGATVVRQQIKWLAAGAAGTIVGSAVAAGLQGAGGGAHAAGIAINVVANPLPALAIAVAILRYRLWELDFVVSKALVYGVLWAAISAALLAPALVAGLAVGGSGAVAAVALALVVTLVFQPVRRRLESLAQRVAYGERAQGYVLLSRFSEASRAAIVAGELPGQLSETVRSLLGANWAAVWIVVERHVGRALHPLAAAGAEVGPSVLLSEEMASWLRENQAPVAGRNAPDELRALWPHQPAAVAPLLAADQLVGVLACGEPPGDRLRDDDFELLGAVARESALVLRNLRLEAQLRERLHEIEAQAAELRHSRGRIVRAQDEERRRIERDLHDGVQQQLVALGARLRRASGSEVRGSQRLLRELAAEAEEAIFALQELGRGIFPSVLADQGLGAALRTQAARIPLAIHVEVEPTLAARRFDRELEAALYFVGLEAMTNAQKHAPAATVTVSLREGERERRLVLAVHDDGPGFNPDAWAAGSGLQNMRDRIGAAGGELRLESRPGAGTWVEASVPLAAEVVELHRDADSRR